MAMRKIHVLLQPIGGTEAQIAATPISISYIGLEQYRLMKANQQFPDAQLYSHDRPVMPGDVLLIMMCLLHVPVQLIARFRHVVYYFDDMNVWKAVDPDYSKQFEKVSIYISPLAKTAEHMNSERRKKSYYVPWSMGKVDVQIVKTETPSVFIDMDEREFTRSSIEQGFDFARICLDAGLQPYVFSRFSSHCPETLRAGIRFVLNLPRPNFLRLLATMWIYASGINSSYEFCVLESAMLGCGLISLHSALQPEHLRRRSCLKYAGEFDFAPALRMMIESLDPKAIQADALLLYPRDAKQKLQEILRENGM